MKKIILTTILAFTACLGLNAQITTGLQAEYLLNANVNDSQNTNDATPLGGFTYSEDRLGVANQAGIFDGFSGRVALPLDLTNIPEISISMWFRTAQPGGLFSHSQQNNPGYYAPILYIGSDGRLMGRFWNGSTGSISTSTQVLTDSLWHHVVITAGAGGQSVYLDNQLVGSITGNIISGSFNNAFIGFAEVSTNWPNMGSSYFKGLIDDVRIYNIAISSAVVDELYNTPTWTPPIYPFQLDTLFVDQNATGNNDGSSWTNAYNDARDAFINTTENCEIWIAEGTYIRNATDRNSVFGWSKDSIMIYGGFVGGETSRDQRDWNANPTIFSGDMGVIGDNSDNAYTVFVGPIGQHTYSLIDGIKITGGNASEDSYPDFNTVGGGMTFDTDVDYVELKNIEIYDNYAKQGGAFSAYGFSGDSIKIKLENVVAHDNTGRSSAFAHIRASNVAPIAFEMVNCLIYENNALESLPNQIQDFGTVLFLGANANINNTIFASITNCTFANNTFAPTHKSKGMIRIFNQTNAPSILEFTNNICFGNGIVDITANNNANLTQAFPTVNLNNNILENGIDFTVSVENNTLIMDPLFNPNYSLQQGSPAIDAGTQVGLNLPMFDLAGNNRIADGQVDLGCFEFSCTPFTTSLTLNNDELAVSGADTYQWYLDNTALNLNNVTSYMPSQDGTYYVIGISAEGCSDTSNVISYCANLIVEITENGNLLTATPNLTNYQWFLDGSLINGASSETYIATQDGVYTCEATENNCTATSNAITVQMATAISNVSFDYLKVFPNPTFGKINIELRENLQTIRILDITGKKIQEFDASSRVIDISMLHTGMYFLELSNNDARSLVKIILK